MDKKFQDMNYKEFIKEVLKLELQPHQEQLLDIFIELKEKQYSLLNKKREFCPTVSEESLGLSMNKKSIAEIMETINTVKTKPTEPEIYIHQL